MPIYKKYNRAFFKTWSPEMAYILGFLFADGNIIKTKRNTHFVSLYTNDLALLSAIKRSLKSEHKLSKSVSKVGGICYKIQIGSKEYFSDLVNLGLIENKARRMKLPIVPLSYQGDFIRGYFDGDGCVWFGNIHKNRKTKTLSILVCFTSASINFLKEIKFLLNTLGLNGGSVFESKKGNYGRLNLSTQDSLKLYEIMYNKSDKLFLSRKKLVFEKFIKMRS
jgi:intein-encoded DNA endonuclease-like protein